MSATAHRNSSYDADDADRSTQWTRDAPRSRVVRVDDDARSDVDRRVESANGTHERGSRFEHVPAAEVAPLPELTAAGAGLVVGVVVSFAAILDRLVSPGLGVIFGFVFILTSVYAAIRMCWRDSWAALAMPPLVFVVAAGLSAQVSSDASGSWVSRMSAEVATAVLDHPIYLLAGTVLAGLVLAYRARVE